MILNVKMKGRATSTCWWKKDKDVGERKRFGSEMKAYKTRAFLTLPLTGFSTIRFMATEHSDAAYAQTEQNVLITGSKYLLFKPNSLLELPPRASP